MTKQHKSKGKKIIRRPKVLARTGISKATLYRLMAAGSFPKSVKLSARAVGWFEDAVDEWLASLR